jgi:hypothetical protein
MVIQTKQRTDTFSGQEKKSQSTATKGHTLFAQNNRATTKNPIH